MPKTVADVLGALRIGLFFILFVFCLAAVIGGPQPYQQSQSAPQNQHEGHKSCVGETFSERLTTDPVAFFTLWLAIFTAVLAISTIGLWIVTLRASVAQARDMKASIDTSQKSVAIAKKTLVTGHRAYIRISLDQTISNSSENWVAGDRPQVTICIENVGSTPARDVVVETVMTISDFPLRAGIERERADINTSRIVAHPHERHRFDVVLDRPFTWDDLRDIGLSGDRRLYIDCRAEYTDVFGNRRWTTFRAMSNRVEGRITLMNSAEGNDAS